MTNKPSRDRISEAAQVVRTAGYADVHKWMLARDKKESRKPRTPKAKKVQLARHGVRVRGGGGYANLANEQIEIIELEQTGKLPF